MAATLLKVLKLQARQYPDDLRYLVGSRMARTSRRLTDYGNAKLVQASAPVAKSLVRSSIR